MQQLERHARAPELDVHLGGIGQRPLRLLCCAPPVEFLLELRLVDLLDVLGVDLLNRRPAHDAAHEPNAHADGVGHLAVAPSQHELLPQYLS
jgi:hypothetical protein